MKFQKEQNREQKNVNSKWKQREKINIHKNQLKIVCFSAKIDRDFSLILYISLIVRYLLFNFLFYLNKLNNKIQKRFEKKRNKITFPDFVF